MNNTLGERRLGIPMRRRTMRADAVLEEHLRQQFRTSPYRELARIQCRFHRGTVNLEGDVSSYYMKQIAQTIARRVHGVKCVCNHISVRISEDPLHARRKNLLVDVE